VCSSDLAAARGDASAGDRVAQLVAADVEAERLTTIVERLLVMTRRIETGVTMEVDLFEAAKRSVARWTDRAQASGADLDLIGSPALARVDPTDVDQILDNLIDNAITHAPGAIEISTGVGSDAAWVTVRDHGPGIAETDVAHVTERFYRGARAPSGGSGLGLAIVRDLVERSGGTLALTSSPGGGTAVRIELPVSRSAADDRAP